MLTLIIIIFLISGLLYILSFFLAQNEGLYYKKTVELYLLF